MWWLFGELLPGEKRNPAREVLLSAHNCHLCMSGHMEAVVDSFIIQLWLRCTSSSESICVSLPFTSISAHFLSVQEKKFTPPFCKCCNAVSVYTIVNATIISMAVWYVAPYSLKLHATDNHIINKLKVSKSQLSFDVLVYDLFCFLCNVFDYGPIVVVFPISFYRIYIINYSNPSIYVRFLADTVWLR